MHPSSRKSIYIPVRGEVRGVDVHDFLPIIDHPHFQRLRDVKQLGQVSLIYPAANHTRFEHSIGTLFELRMRISSWPGQLTDDESRLLEAYALLHDIGHPAFSHATERVLGQDHKDIALVFLSDMKEVIEQCHIDFNRLEAIFCKKDPLETIISNHPLGVDKFDYLYRDSRFTCMDKPNIASLDGHIFWDNNRLVVDSSHGIIRTAQRLRELYI